MEMLIFFLIFNFEIIFYLQKKCKDSIDTFVKTKKPTFVYYSELNSRLYLALTGFSINGFFSVPGSNPGYHIAFGCYIFFVTPGLWQFFSLCFSWPWPFWGILVRYFLGCAIYRCFDLSDQMQYISSQLLYILFWTNQAVNS